jgi:wyosine [tRNA(Phe)-imidazoG37] synthetase (radical SAM superfamily)
MGDWTYRSDKVTFINLSIYPSPCQSKCIYCHYISDGFSLTDDVKAGYDKLFDFLGYLKNHDKLDNHIVWQISPGEITIHPYRNKLYKLVGDMTAIFFTNAFIFDKKIAIKIRNNQQSKVNVSLDSGTPSTWKKVKGVDNFDTVINNLMKYREYSEQDISEQIVLKYIILPGINTNMKDYFGFMKIMKLLRINCLQLSRNLNVAYQPSTKEHKILIDNVIKLASLAQSHGFKYYLYPGAFTQDDINNINDAVKQKTVDKSICKNEK